MSIALTVASKAGGAGISYLTALLDPGLRRRLNEEITNHVLSEIPRIVRILKEQFEEVQASGCTVQEANVIAHQVVEAQQRTLDEDKRRRLSNVLINGLCSPRWDKAKLRLLIRLTSELEEEHISVLQWYAATPDERKSLDAKDPAPSSMVETAPGVHEWRPSALQIERWDFQDALARELISRGLMNEFPTPKVVRPWGDDEDRTNGVDDVELEWEREVTILGDSLLEHLRDPEE